MMQSKCITQPDPVNQSPNAAQDPSIEDRIKKLGLWDCKVNFEQLMLSSLRSDLRHDNLYVSTFDKNSRKRPVKEHVSAISSQILNSVQGNVIKDSSGKKSHYKLTVMMGIFTHSVTHDIVDTDLIVSGKTIKTDGKSLQKVVKIQLPENIDTSRLEGTFSAGNFKCEAPFKVT